MLIMPYDTGSQSRNVLASPLGEEGHEVAKGWTVVRMIMTLDVDVTAERRHYNTHRPLMGSLCIISIGGAADWRSGPRWGVKSALCLVHPFPLRGTSPQGETRSMEEKDSESYTSRTISAFSPFGGWRHHLSPRKRGHYGCLAMESCLYRKA